MESIYTIIATVVIPFLVQGLKKIIPTKFAPAVAVLLAIIYVVIARVMNLDVNLQETLPAILAALGISGASVLGYDIVKSIRGD